MEKTPGGLDVAAGGGRGLKDEVKKNVSNLLFRQHVGLGPT